MDEKKTEQDGKKWGGRRANAGRPRGKVKRSRTGKNNLANKNSSKVNYAIERHAKKLSKKLFLYVKNMLA